MLQHYQHSIGLEHAPDLVKSGYWIRDLAEDQRFRHPIEGGVAEWKRLRITGDERRPRALGFPFACRSIWGDTSVATICVPFG